MTSIAGPLESHGWPVSVSPDCRLPHMDTHFSQIRRLGRPRSGGQHGLALGLGLFPAPECPHVAERGAVVTDPTTRALPSRAHPGLTGSQRPHLPQCEDFNV